MILKKYWLFKLNYCKTILRKLTMEIDQNTERGDKEVKGLDILDFIQNCNDDNYYERLTGLLETKDQSNKTIREQLLVKKPMVDNEHFSVHQVQFENIKILAKNNVKSKVDSTFLAIFCIKPKQGEMFDNEEQQTVKLLELSKACINLKSDYGHSCTEDDLLLFSCCRYNKVVEEENEEFYYFSVIAFNKLGSIH